MQCYHKSAGAAFITVLAIIAIYSQEQKMKHSGVQEWLRMHLRESKFKKKIWSGVGGDVPGPPRYAGTFGSIP